MPKPPSTDISGLEIPRECAVLRAAYERSGLSVGAISKATGISTTAIHIAMNGYRYRGGETHVTVPPDNTVVKLAAVLRIEPSVIRGAGRARAAALLEEASVAGLKATTDSDEHAQALAAGRNALAIRVLAAFSTDELQAELNRRARVTATPADDAEDDAEVYAELADDLRSAQYPG